MNKTVNVKNITLISMGIALNVVGAFIALNLRLPIYLDSIGTILIAWTKVCSNNWSRWKFSKWNDF